MRKFGLLAAAVTMALGGSIVKADFVVSHSRATDAFTIGSTEYDIVTFSVVNNGLNGTGESLGTADVALYAPNNGMVISIPSSGTTPGLKPDVYGTGTESTKADSSWINGTIPGLSTIKGRPILLSSGGNLSTDTGTSGGVYNNTYTNQELVAGISGTIFATPGNGVVDTNPADGGAAVVFAQVAVPAGDPVELLAPGALNRVGIPSSFENTASGFASDSGTDGTGNYTPLLVNVVDGTLVPEPASLGIFGIMAAGLLARRRHA